MKKWILAVIVVGVMIALAQKMKGAVTIDSNPTDEEYSQVYSTGLFSWSVVFETGYPSTSTPEIRVTTNHLVTSHHVWSTPDPIGVDYDEAGNLNIRAGSTTLSAQPITPFNAICIRLSDRARFSTYTEFKNIIFNTITLRNMFADDLGTFITDNDYQIVRGVGDTFSLSGNFFRSFASVGNESQLEIVGVWVVPEPSSSMLLLMSTVCLIFRRR
jgi:hypothetical protein